MMVNGHRNRGAALLGLAAAGLFASLGCDAAPASTTVDIAGLRPGPDKIHAQEVLRCCERHFLPRRRAECVFEGLHDHGVCAERPVPPHDAGARDAGRDLAMRPDAGSKDAAAPDGHVSSPDAGARDAGATDGHSTTPDAARASCPTLTPLKPNFLGTIPVGATVEIFVSAIDPDGDATGLTFAWSTTGGDLEAFPTTSLLGEADGFADFLCTDAGTETVTVTMADGACPLTESVNLTCSFCGDGVVESGEDCDPPNATPDGRILCDSSCHFIGTCGNGRLDPGEQCDPPNPGSCGNDCQLAAVCGDGLIGPGEQCDPPHQGPVGLQCDSNCQLLTCGNGVLDPGEQCDPPDGVTCDAQCQAISSVCGDGIIQPGETCDFTNGQFCINCQITACGNCFFQSLGPQNMNPAPTDLVCQALSGVARTNCQALLNCMSRSFSHCVSAQPAGAQQTACYCSDATCSQGANGQCAAQFATVAGTTDPTAILGELNSPTSLLSSVRAEAVKFGTSSCGSTCALIPPPI